MTKEWRPVPGFEEAYLVSDDGGVLSVRHTTKCGLRGTDLVKRQRKSINGYLLINLSLGKKTRTAKTHRLVAEAFLPNPEGKPWVNHKDGNKANNHVANLEWSTVAENHQHAWRTGLQGERTRAAVRQTMQQVNVKRRKAVIAVPVDQALPALRFQTTHHAKAAGFDQSSVSLACRGGFRKDPHLYRGYRWAYEQQANAVIATNSVAISTPSLT